MLRGLTSLVVIVIIFGALLGLAMGSIDLLNPATSSAKARQMNEQAAAQAAKNAYEQSLREIQLEKQRALANIEVEQKKLREQALTDGLAVLLMVVPFGVFAVLLALAIFIICAAATKLRGQVGEVQELPRAEGGQVIPHQPKRSGVRSPAA